MEKRFFRKIVLGLALGLFSINLYASQKRLTEHRLYLGGGDGSGKIYFIKHESGENWDLWKMDEYGLNIYQLTNDDLLEGVDGGVDFFPNKTKIAITKKSQTHDYIYTMDSTGENPREIYSTENHITQLKVSPNGNKIAFVEEKPGDWKGTLYLVDQDGKNLRALLKDQVRWDDISFSPCSSKIAFVNKDGYLSTIGTDGKGLATITTFHVNNPYWLKSGKIVFTRWDAGTCSLATINPDGSEYNVLYSTTDYIENFSISPDEEKIAINLENMIVILSNGSVLEEIPLETEIKEVSWVSNTKLVYFDFKDIFTINIDDLAQTNLTKNDREAWFGLLDAKGNRIIYEIADKLYSMDIDGTDKILLLELAEDQDLENTELSPNGEKLLYVLNKRGTNYLYVRNSDGSKPKYLDGGYYYTAKLSPNGLRVAYLDNQGVGPYTIKTNGTDKVKIADSGDPEFAWSPDSTKIVYTHRPRGWFSKIYIADADGRNSYDLNPAIKIWASDPIFARNKIIYGGDYDIWSSDYKPLEGPIIVYNPDGTIAGYATEIQEGINACPIGGTVSVSPETYTEAIYINKSIALIGIGTPTITAEGFGNIITFDGASALISGFIITGATGWGKVVMAYTVTITPQ